MNCWQCGVEPEAVEELTTAASATPIQLIPVWGPGGDHLHAVTPPTPQDLAEAGHHRLMRIRDQAII